MLLPVLAVSCGQNKGTGNGDEMLEYSPQVNEVEVIRLEETDFQWQLLANGKLSASKRSRLPFRTAGVITEINVRNGQRVSEGEVLGRQDSREQALALESARISFAKAELDLYGYNAAANALRQAEYVFGNTILKAPFTGVVADVAYRQYDMTGSDPFCTLVDDSAFDVDFMVLESEYPNVSAGMDVTVTPFVDGNRSMTGRIISVNPAVDKNGQVLVRARVSNDGSLVDGMNVRVKVESPVPGRLVVPKSAVVIRDRQHVLFRYKGGKALWTYVNVLMSNSGSYAVEANTERGATLSAGDTVIVSGNLNIADGSEVILKSE